MSRYLYQEACPFCGGRGGTYYAGDSFSCFSCHAYMGQGKGAHRTAVKASDGIDMPYTNTKFSFDALMWLTKCGINKSMIHKYNIRWQPELQQVILPIIIDDEIVAYEAREFLSERKAINKYTSRGPKVKKMTLGTGSTLVMVEDCLSAYRVAEFASVMPLCGGTIRWDDCVKACLNYKEIVLWLDGDDGGDQARSFVRGMLDKVFLSLLRKNAWNNFTLPEIRYIITEKDPKECSNKQIKELLNG